MKISKATFIDRNKSNKFGGNRTVESRKESLLSMKEKIELI